MRNAHIHDHLTDEQRIERDNAIVADYVGGMRYRGIIKKYRIAGTFIATLLKERGVKSHKNAPRNWVNKRVRPNGAVSLVCSKCKMEKPIDQFPSTGLVCRCCTNVRLSIWRDANRAEINLYIKEWMRAKKRKDGKYRALCAMKVRLVRLLAASSQRKNGNKMTYYLGISRAGFIAHIESMMLPGMTWENRSRGVWHIDHIIPCNAFDHECERQVLECWHYTNLRPMWGPENLRKYNKITVDSLIGPKMCADVSGEKSLA